MRQHLRICAALCCLPELQDSHHVVQIVPYLIMSECSAFLKDLHL